MIHAALLSLAAATTPAAPLPVVDDGPGEWIQLTFDGRIEAPGGARVELAVGAIARGELPQGREVAIHPHLAAGTTAADVAALLAQRLERAEIDAWLSESVTVDGESRCHLFVERAVLVRVRFGHGLSASVTICEGAPDSLKIEPPTILQEEALLMLTASTLHPHTNARRREEFRMSLTPEMHASRISEALTSYCVENGGIAERPHPDSWRLVKLRDGASLVGLNVQLATGGDWLLELRFRP